MNPYSPSQTSAICVAGIGGFAAVHHQELLKLEEEGVVKVLATCDPYRDRLQNLCEDYRFAARGVSTLTSFEEMLSDARYDWASIATPIGLHASMHRACVERELPCYLEKPPTLDPAELSAMIACDTLARRKTQVGFNYVYEPLRLELKQRLLAGEFGTLRRVTLQAAWPRGDWYYSRNAWAGRLQMGDTLLLDSCLGNAMAHHVHNVLFLAGQGTARNWATCETIEARLFRANPIEGADTVFLRGSLKGGIDLRIALTHACEGNASTEETLHCDDAILRFRPGHSVAIERSHGEQEILSVPERAYLRENFRIFDSYVRGETDRLLSTLEDCRPFVELNALAYISSGTIATVPSLIAKTETDGNTLRFIPGISEQLSAFVESGIFPDLGVASASSPVAPRDAGRLQEAVRSLRETAEV